MDAGFTTQRINVELQVYMECSLVLKVSVRDLMRVSALVDISCSRTLWVSAVFLLNLVLRTPINSVISSFSVGLWLGVELREISAYSRFLAAFFGSFLEAVETIGALVAESWRYTQVVIM